MTKEQIVKALECCGNKACEDCPMEEMDRCVTILLKNTIAFTRELLEENEKLKRALDDKFGNWLKLYDATEKYHSELFKEAKIAVKEDTVRKRKETKPMRERLIC